jgi:glycosyltransferase involved in cell wall biosynthesis
MTDTPAPVISVVVPTYNRADNIRRCLDSVLNQTISPSEIIVVDDGSSDETVKRVKEIRDARVRCVVLEKNSGAQAARNRGIREATGDWIAFQDSDDAWLPEKLAKQVKALQGTGCDPWTVVHTNAIWKETATGKHIQVQMPVVDGDDVYAQLLTRPAPLFPGMLVSRIALRQIGYLDEKVPAYQEWDTAIRLAKHCRFIYVKEPLFVYNLHEGGMISKNRLHEVRAYQYVIDKFRDEIRGVCGEGVWRNHLYEQLIRCLNFKLWSESEKYFAQVSEKNVHFLVLRFCRHLHIRPDIVVRMKHALFRPKEVRQAKACG